MHSIPYGTAKYNVVKKNCKIFSAGIGSSHWNTSRKKCGVEYLNETNSLSVCEMLQLRM